MAVVAAGAIRSPNIWGSAATYELENRAVDPTGAIEAAMRRHRSWHGSTFLDLGCGSGFHLPTWAKDAADVVGVEPHGGLVSLARRRTGHLANVRVLRASAQRLPLPGASVDVVHARWAYFFGPGCEAGLRELGRVVRRGGTAFVIDNDATRSTFGTWFRRSLPAYDPGAVERFWSLRGWRRQSLDAGWVFDRRADLEAVVRMEFPAPLAAEILAEHPGTSVDYAVNLWIRDF